MFKVLILGGGASGVFSAILLAKKLGSYGIAILEGSERLMKKLSLTGNGQGNLSNSNMDKSFFLGDERFIDATLSQFSLNDTLNIFNELGIEYVEKENGRIYPKSFQASSVSDIFRLTLEKYNVQTFLNEEIIAIENKGDYYLVSTKNNAFKTQSVVYALGGASMPKLLTREENFSLLKKLGHTILTLSPAIVQLKAALASLKMLKGIKARVGLSLQIDGKVIKSVEDEIHFADGSLSGPSTFFLSPLASKLLSEKNEVVVKIDFFPEYSFGELLELLFFRAEKLSSFFSEQLFSTLTHNQIGRFILKECKISSDRRVDSLTDLEMTNLVKVAKGLLVKITSTFNFNFSQSTVGGVSLLELDPNTMQSKLHKNLYVLGEATEVCGLCGGYNLQWAWSSAGAFAKNFNL